MKLYLLDANVLITANRDYYSMEMVPVFWEWLLHMAERGHVKMPIETLEEVRDGGGKVKKDALVSWLNRADVYEKLVLEEDAVPEIVAAVMAKGYAPDLDETELEAVGRDPFLIAYAAADRDNRVVVSIEVSAPAKKRANRRVPDACHDNGVSVCNTFTMLRELGFTTAWIKPAA
ncbi:DUF4411 family protein [Paraburkholderia megapolitana]|uniref:PIN domain-containing protein n=1 Tax=Paraburkholderia megapolitana TaxID=420953 RepID=A0A1I3FS72_9BURK|nr:DUF4411 family protein [Paraburkholderia megapolitana]QDQ82525.1 DUF4411 family protein [Paraburkholderia megapolitana]SFI14024.1 protein of unknown function [Paraburkholderia megapolitana]